MKEKIREYLKENKISALELSRISGVKRSTLYNILNDVIDPLSIGTSRAIALARAMNMTVDELVGTATPSESDAFSAIRQQFGADGLDLLQKYNQLNSNGKSKLLTDLEDMLELEKYLKKRSQDVAI